MQSNVAIRAIVFTLAALTAGCTTVVQDPGDDYEQREGIADLTWQVGSQGCAAGGVAQVALTVGETTWTAPCDDGGMLVDLPAGTWDLVLEAIDDDGIARYSGEALDVRVMGGDITVVPTVLLGANPADLTVTWYFENGRLCGGNGVVGVDIALFDEDYIVAELETTCDDGIEPLVDLVAGEYSLLVLGRDDTGRAIFQGDQIVVLEKGGLVRADVELIAL